MEALAAEIQKLISVSLAEALRGLADEISQEKKETPKQMVTVTKPVDFGDPESRREAIVAYVRTDKDACFAQILLGIGCPTREEDQATHDRIRKLVASDLKVLEQQALLGVTGVRAAVGFQPVNTWGLTERGETTPVQKSGDKNVILRMHTIKRREMILSLLYNGKATSPELSDEIERLTGEKVNPSSLFRDIRGPPGGKKICTSGKKGRARVYRLVGTAMVSSKKKGMQTKKKTARQKTKV